MKTKLSPYTIASNCTDLTDIRDGINEIQDEMKRLVSEGKNVPSFFYSRLSKLQTKRKKFEQKNQIHMNVTIRFFIDKELEADNGLPADVKAEAARKAEERLKYMTFYSTTPKCLRGFLLEYFGEAAPKKCGNCSCCLAAEQEAQLQLETSRRRAADNAHRLEKPRRTKSTAGAAPLSEADEKLLNALYARRKWLAGKQNVPAFMVFSDATLREMVEKKPLSLDELLNISGVGEKKAARYGTTFLRIIEDAVENRE